MSRLNFSICETLFTKSEIYRIVIVKGGEDMSIIGQRIKYLRESANLTQIELANILNIQNSTLSQYETGLRTPSDEVKIRIAKYFSVSLDYLMGINNDLEENQDHQEKTNEIENLLHDLSKENKDKALDYINMLKKLDDVQNSKQSTEKKTI